MKALRIKGILAFAIVFALVYIFTVFYMDHLIRRTIVKQGTRLNGALVDVDSARLSLLRSSFIVKGLRATDPADLMRNRVDIGEIVMDLQFLPLLKKKVILDNVTVGEVRWATARSKSGATPAAWAKEWAEEENEPDSVWAQAYASIEKEIVKELPDVDLAKLGENFDPRSFVQLETLESYKQATALPQKLKSLGSEWTKKGTDLADAQKAKLTNLRADIDSLNPQNLKDPASILKAIEKVQNLKKEIESSKSELKRAQTETITALSEQAGQVTNLQKAFDDDIRNLKSKIGFGGLNLDRLSQSIFGLTVAQKYRSYLRVYEKVRPLLASSDNKKEPKPERGKGRNVRFPITDGTPSFLLTKLHLSADTKTNETVPEAYRGVYLADAARISSDLKAAGPASAELSANLTQGAFSRARLSVELSRPQEALLTKGTGLLKGYKLGERVLGEGSFFPIPIQSAVTDFELKLAFEGDQMQASARGDFSAVAYAFKPVEKEHFILGILKEVIQSIRTFNLEIGLKGTLSSPSLSIQSTLDNAFKDGIQKVLRGKLAEAQAKLEAYLRKEIGGKVAEAQKMFDAKKAEATSALDAQLKNAGEIEALANKRIDDLKKRQTSSLKDKIPKKLF